MATGFPVKRTYDTKSLMLFIKQIQNFKKVRMFGAAAIMGTFVACGRVDAYFEDEIMIWDVCAAVALTNAAGVFNSFISFNSKYFFRVSCSTGTKILLQISQ